MMRFFSRKRPKIKIQASQRDGFSGWLKCTECHEMIHGNELEKTDHCCPKCDHHYRLPVGRRIAMLTDPDSFQELFTGICSTNPLSFKDTLSYEERIKRAKEKSGRNAAIQTGIATLEKTQIALAVMDFTFMGGSMGSALGERLTRLIEHAAKEGLPLVVVASSGGARMQESIFSLMQMAKTSAALAKLDTLGLPFISILTNPTTGGVTASFASLGDVIIAEPDALIGFAGPRVIEQTIGQKLPEGSQESEFLLKHGMIDCIVKRRELKKNLVNIINLLTQNKRDYVEPSKEDHCKPPSQGSSVVNYPAFKQQ